MKKVMKFSAFLLAALMLGVTCMTACQKERDKPVPSTSEPIRDTAEPAETPTPEPSGIKEEDKYGGVFVYPWSGDPNTLLYAWLTSGRTNTMSSFLNDKLYVLEEDGSIQYRIADRIDINEDETEYTFHIRQGARWHDGVQITAEDMVWTYGIAEAPDSFLQTGIIGVVRKGEWSLVSEDTFKITLEKRDPLFLSWLQDEFFPQPKHYYDGVPIKDFPTSPQAVKPIGCGPFKFAEYKVGDYLKLVANEDYWAGRPYLDEVYFKIIGGGEYAHIAFENGEISYIEASPEYYPEIKDDNRFIFVEGPSENVANLDLSETRLYKFDKDGNRRPGVNYIGDRAIREAMAYMIPYDEMISKVLRGACERSYSIMCKGGQYYTEEGLNKYTYDLDKANKILDDAGYVDTDGDQIRNWKDGSNIVILCTTFSPGSLMERMGILFAEQLSNCGIASGMKTEEMMVWSEHFLSGMENVKVEDIQSIVYLWEYSGFGSLAGSFAETVTSTGQMSQFLDYDLPGHPIRATIEDEYEPAFLEKQRRIDEIFEQMYNADEATAAELFAEYQRIAINDMIGFIPIGTMLVRDAFQKNVHVEDAMWSLNSNYTLYAPNKIWIEKGS